jgi:Na+/H+ antiporter NhaD/arsenite permease-like protein
VQHPYIAISIFAVVYFLIIFGRGKFKIPIWISMLICTALMISFQIISTETAIKSINLDVIGFLFGMFSIVSALDMSGVLRMIAVKMLSKTNSNPDLILMVFVVGMGVLSAFLVNDTIAILGVPLIIVISKQIGIRPRSSYCIIFWNYYRKYNDSNRKSSKPFNCTSKWYSSAIYNLHQSFRYPNFN